MYKVGDKVLVVATIDEVDENDNYFPYSVTFRDGPLWIGGEEIFSNVPSIDEESEMKWREGRETPDLKYKIGDKVYHKYKKEWGIGVIDGIDPDCFTIEYMEESYKFTDDIYSPYSVTYPSYKDSVNSEPYEAGWYTAESNIELIGEAKEKQNDQG
jgi:hypothetical protein